MTGPEIVSRTRALNLPQGSYIVFGSCPLALAGIRETDDIDLLISESLYTVLLQKGWYAELGRNGDKPLRKDIFDAHTNWHIGSYNPTLSELLTAATTVDGVSFASLDAVKAWKSILRRPKDLTDINSINAYQKNNPDTAV